MKKIYIHIGCGKTGSSALQLWLHQNINNLLEAGISYPSDIKKLDKYAITSGNGTQSVSEILAGRSMEYFSDLANCDQHICLSSEAFQLLKKEHLTELKTTFEQLKLKPIIIAYVRDVYDMMYSSYLQLVKRNLFSRSFETYVLSQRNLQQFDVIELWSNVFNDINLLHYDSIKTNIAQPFCGILEIDYANMDPLHSIKVNRSLSLIEGELVRFLNECYVRQTGKQASAVFCEKISNALIYSSPELNTEILYNHTLEKDMENKFSKAISNINTKFFNGNNTLHILRKEGKNLTNQAAALPAYLTAAITELFNTLPSVLTEDKTHSITKDSNIENQPLTEHDERLIPFLVGAAAKRKNTKLNDALSLLLAAKVLRPTGVIINERINEYTSLLKAKG